LQTMFTMLGAAEKAGSGIDKIRRGWESQHWRMPRVNEQMQPDRVAWMLPMVSLIPDESLQRLKMQFGAAFDRLSNLEVQALVTADVENRVDNQRLRQISGKHASDITSLFQRLVARGSLIKEGHARWSWYHLPDVKTEACADTEDDSFLGKGDSFLGKGDSFLGKINQLEEVAHQARVKKRIPKQQMRSIILELCDGRWLSKVQIAQLLMRNAEDLRNRYINPMVSEGLLQLRYPETPRRDDQTYRATGGDSP